MQTRLMKCSGHRLNRDWPPKVALASSRRACRACATPCSSSWRTWNAHSSGKSHNPAHSGSHNCAWGPPPPAAKRQPAVIQRSEKECLFSMVPPWGHDAAVSNYHRSLSQICPQQSTKLLIFHAESPSKRTWIARLVEAAGGVKRGYGHSDYPSVSDTNLSTAIQ